MKPSSCLLNIAIHSLSIAYFLTTNPQNKSSTTLLINLGYSKVFNRLVSSIGSKMLSSIASSTFESKTTLRFGLVMRRLISSATNYMSILPLLFGSMYCIKSKMSPLPSTYSLNSSVSTLKKSFESILLECVKSYPLRNDPKSLS
jgi:hypothetical protein